MAEGLSETEHVLREMAKMKMDGRVVPSNKSL